MFHHFHGSGHQKSEGSFSADEFGRALDHASKVGVQYVAQPGGSVADEEVINSNKFEEE
jgi:AICAR transformylase/IMP cyclohydrolase PurH